MCHADQTLNEHVAKHGRGFWPEAGQALVGGSYILFEESSVVGDNLCPAELSKVSLPVQLGHSDVQEDRHWTFTNGRMSRWTLLFQ